MSIKFKYQAGNVAGGYAFSANNETITLPGFVEGLPKEDQEVITYEAVKARELYVATVNAKKASGEKVNPLTIKKESVEAAIEATIDQFGEEEYNRVKLIVDQNKGGNLSVSGKSKKASKAKANKVAKTEPTVTADVDLDVEFDANLPDDLDVEFDEGADLKEADEDPASDPFSDI